MLTKPAIELMDFATSIDNRVLWIFVADVYEEAVYPVSF